jgi:radical SAM protein with 4Fe4S-binding SPASM domain
MFDKIYLEITDICNLACPFCPPTSRPAELMPRERFVRILDRLEGQGRLLYFHLKGEPLLHPLLGDFLALAADRGFMVSLTTNGTLVEGGADTLLAAPGMRKLSISLHSHSGSGGVEGYWQGVSAFLDLHRRKPAFPVSLRLWNRDSGGLPPETARLWELVRKRYPPAGAWEDIAKRGSSLKLDERVYLNQADRFDWPGVALPELEGRGYCHGLRNQIGILVDGTVVPCCLDGEGVMALGNILETSVGEIMDSPRAKAIRDGFSRGELVEHLCRTCGYRRRFPARG